MHRVPEPELIEDLAHAMAYSNGIFNEIHSKTVNMFSELFPGVDIEGHVLDLGCGPGEITLRFVQRFPAATFVAIDGAEVMINLARDRLTHMALEDGRVQFIKSLIPSDGIPSRNYRCIISTNFLHHLHNPKIFWQTIKQQASSGTYIFLTDLYRPPTRKKAKWFVSEYASRESELLKRDYFNSLLASFEPNEIERQINESELSELRIKLINDRHLVIYGIRK